MQTELTIIHIVSGVSHDVGHTQRAAADEFLCEAIDRSGAKCVVGRRQIDEIRVVRHNGAVFMLVCAFAGTTRMKRAYGHAITKSYRFFSYGDACLLHRDDGND